MKVKFLKSHPAFAYFEGDDGELEPEKVQELIASGHVILFPGVSFKEEDEEKPKKPGKPKYQSR